MPIPTSAAKRSTIGDALAEARGHCVGIALISAVVNILMFAGPLYMLQVYDRVMASRSLPTLVALTVLLVMAYGFQGFLDLMRGRIVVRIGRLLDERLSAVVFSTTIRASLQGKASSESTQPTRDLDSVRTFLSGQGPVALLDLPWIPVFVLVAWLIHPWIGIATMVGTLLLLVLALAAELSGRAAQATMARDAGARLVMLDSTRRNAEVITTMGMGTALTERWHRANRRFLDAAQHGSDIVGRYTSLTRAFRLLLQSAMLGLGAFLVLRQEMTGGAIIAGSIIAGRAFSPVEAVIANWRGFTAARLAVARLRRIVPEEDSPAERTALAPPAAGLQVQNVVAGAPGSRTPILGDLTFALNAGESMGIIGPSAAGKTSLARVLIGAWPPARGTVRLDGAELAHWDPEALGPHVGYLPQSSDLFDGTIAENIARMALKPDADAVRTAAIAADAHDMIQKLPNGYDTRIGDAALVLSAGQRQRIGLARAVYGNPFLVVLDEPNANLDTDGEAAVIRTIQRVRARGGIAIVIAHRPSAIAACDKLLYLVGGRMQAFGPRDEVLRKVLAPPPGRAATTPAAPTARVANAWSVAS